MIKIKSFFNALLKCVKQFPIEGIFGLTMFIVGVIVVGINDTGSSIYNKLGGVLILSYPLFVLIYLCHQWWQRGRRGGLVLYVASYFAFVPFLFIDISTREYVTGDIFSWVLATLLLIFGMSKMDNRRFSWHVSNVIAQMFFTILISGVMFLAVTLIWESMVYIFNISDDNYVLLYLAMIIGFIIMPLLFCHFMNDKQGDDGEEKPLAKIPRIIIDFILSPAILIYTVILYVYFIKIVVRWDLPKGGIGYMVMAFITVSLFGMLMQNLLKKHYYNWFYRYFAFISLPTIAMFWVGTAYRISLYSLTEFRVYLILAGVLMTLFIFMLMNKHTRRFQIMIAITCIAIVVFTYIPGISASSIGIYSQEARFENLAKRLNLFDSTTHKLKQNIDMNEIKSNSHFKKDFNEASGAYIYLKDKLGHEVMMSKYGFSKQLDGDVIDVDDEDYTLLGWEGAPCDVGDYCLTKGQDDNSVNFNDGNIEVIDLGGKVVLSYPIQNIVDRNPGLVEKANKHPECLLMWKNDSVLLVIGTLRVNQWNDTYEPSGCTVMYKKKK
jgi:hypothetical protein